MRLPFRIPSREQILQRFFSKLISQFGPLLAKIRDRQLEDDLEELRLLVAQLVQLSGGPGWVESTQAAVLDMAKQVTTLHEVVQHHHKILEEMKRTEDMWRGGRAMSKLH
jgi:hypothetical protein